MVQYGPRRLKPSAAGPPFPNDTMQNMQLFRGVYWFCNHWMPVDMVPSGTMGTGTIVWGDTYLELNTGDTGGSFAGAAKGAVGLTGAFSWGKKRFFGMRVFLTPAPDKIFHLVSGYITNFFAVINTEPHIGFKMDGPDLYGTVGNGTAESTLLLLTLLDPGYYTLECVLTPGVECRFYVNGVDVGAITTNLPTGTAQADLMFFATIANTTDETRLLYLYESRTLQEE